MLQGSKVVAYGESVDLVCESQDGFEIGNAAQCGGGGDYS